jgi:hypothetical protein
MTWNAEWVNERDLGYSLDIDLIMTDGDRTERRSFNFEYDKFTVDQAFLDDVAAAVAAELDAPAEEEE